MNKANGIAALLFVVACAPAGPADVAEPGWVGTITSEAGATTVVNESGSVWGGMARLVEEASIGVEAGGSHEMLGQVRGVAASADRIYVLDAQIPTVRVYDFAGAHLLDLGGAGEGPGEFTNPDYLALGPAGAIYVRAGMQGRLTIFEPDGRVRDTWPMPGGTLTGRPTVVTPAGTVFMPGTVTRGADVLERRRAMIAWGPDGARDEVIEEPAFDLGDTNVVARGDGPTLALPVPFMPRGYWTLAPSGAVISGTSDDYGFVVRQPGGETLEVRKRWDPVPVADEEADWHVQDIVDSMRTYYPDWTWNGPEVPATKPPYTQLFADHSGRVWVVRSGPGAYNPECDAPEPPRGTDCWIEATELDVFGADGRFLGPVEVPDDFELRPPPFIRDDVVIAVEEDEAGTIRVKRYRLELPGER